MLSFQPQAFIKIKRAGVQAKDKSTTTSFSLEHLFDGLHNRLCTAFFITWTCKGMVDTTLPRFSNLSVVELSGKTSGLLSTMTRDWCCVY